MWRVIVLCYLIRVVWCDVMHVVRRDMKKHQSILRNDVQNEVHTAQQIVKSIKLRVVRVHVVTSIVVRIGVITSIEGWEYSV